LPIGFPRLVIENLGVAQAIQMLRHSNFILYQQHARQADPESSPVITPNVRFSILFLAGVGAQRPAKNLTELKPVPTFLAAQLWAH
jgi:hypothetical protein